MRPGVGYRSFSDTYNTSTTSANSNGRDVNPNNSARDGASTGHRWPPGLLLFGRRSTATNASQPNYDSNPPTGDPPNSTTTARTALPTIPLNNDSRRWSLFEEVMPMENDGQVRSPGRYVPRQYSSAGLPSTRSWASSIVQSPEETPTRGGGYFVGSVGSLTRPSTRSGSMRDVTGTGGGAGAEVQSDSDSDSNETTTTVQVPRASRWTSSASRRIIPARIPTIPVLWKNVLKCCVAYFIASMFTFQPYLSHFFGDLVSYGSGSRGPLPSGHMIATIAVYYNPAKTIGGMIEADSFCTIAWLYSAFVCLSGMSLFWWLGVQLGWDSVADFVPILWVGLSMWGLSWMKMWMAKATFNSACSMAGTLLFVVIVLEGGLGTFLQVSLIVLVGTLISNVVCFSLWPQSATDNLQANMIKTLDSFSTLLQMLTSTFLLEEPLRKPSHEKMQKAVENHQSSFTSLKKNLAEARSEWFGILDERDSALSKQAYGDAVDSLTRLAQHLNGLRGGMKLQYELAKAQSEGKLVLKRPDTMRRQGAGGDEDTPSSPTGKGRIQRGGVLSHGDELEEALLQVAADMFGDLMDDVGPPLKALSNTCASCLKRLREAFVRSQLSPKGQMMQPQDFHAIIDGIERALFTFESTSNHALLRLYRRSNFSFASSRRSMSSSIEDTFALADSEQEHVFLVYFFMFTLQEFSWELISLTDAMRRMYAVELTRATSQSWLRRNLVNGPKTTYFGSHQHPKVSFPKVRPHAPNTIQTPDRSNLTFTGRLKRSLWDLGDHLKERNFKYAFKVGMSTAVLAAPAFFEVTRPVFTEYRGEWALLSTNFLSIHRVLGTLFGAIVAATVYTLFPDNGVALSIFGFFFSVPCFYYIVAKPGYATTGRFVLLTYNLTCLYSFNLRENDISVLDTAYHRSAAVIVGVLWALIVSRFWWPSEARRELSKALGEFCLNIGWLYTRLVASNSGMNDFLDERDDTDEPSRSQGTLDEGTPLLSKMGHAKLSTSIQEFMAMELHLQIKLIELQGLLAQTQHEPRLKGPFPVLLYRSVLTSLQTILDKLHSMRCVTTREECVRRDFILPVNKERRDMVGNIILYFSTLASAFRLKAPLPPYLPPAEKARERLVAAIRNLDVVKNQDVKASRQLLFFAYALTMKGVTQELDYLGKTLQDAFGVIGESAEEFDALFVDEDGADEARENGSVV
ncbi:hypothetical protein F5I97DRAFT_1804311 [Phlebopus sp. FC_14]|nr:hypothetical protein F5I97DRAFT_1804311 [Phlebopus sp. FC_14]